MNHRGVKFRRIRVHVVLDWGLVDGFMNLLGLERRTLRGLEYVWFMNTGA